ncbi:MAG TPA: pectate lyase [Candidatus Didemnitutus sp.]
MRTNDQCLGRLLVLALLAGALAAVPLAAGSVTWREILRQPAPWYGGPDARRVAAAVLQYQTDSGGWPKNHDMTVPPSAEFLAEQAPDHRAPTIDNDATTTQIEFLARVTTAGDDAGLRPAILRGLDYLLAAQYENGGWPQYYPLRHGYYTHITFNDDAMVNALSVLQAVASDRAPYAWVDSGRRTRAAAAVQRGIACILRCQVVVNGHKTVWCAQHDEVTLAPAPARRYEMVSLSGGESVGIVRFLMSLDAPSPEVVDAVESAVAWFRASALHGIRWETVPAPALPGGKDRVVVRDAAAPPIWARFYEIGSNRPIFSGRDSVIRYDVARIEHERRVGYAWYRTDARALLERDYPAWRTRRKS